MSTSVPSSPPPRPIGRRVLVALAALLLAALGAAGCDPGPELPDIRRLRVRRLSRGYSARPWPVRLQGRHLATSKAHPLRFQLLRVTPFWPRVRASLERVRITGQGKASAEIPAGLAPGVYRLVVMRGRRWRLARQRIRVRKPGPNVGPPILASVTSRHTVRRAGGRLVVTGANLRDPVLVTLHGPQHRSTRPLAHSPPRRAAPPRPGPPRVTVPGVTDQKPGMGPTRRHGHSHAHGRKRPKRKLRMPFKPRYRRMRVEELSLVTGANPTRVLARMPEWIRPGRYYVQVYTQTHRGQAPETVLVVRPGGPGPARLWGGVWLGLILLGGVASTWRFARPGRVQRRPVVFFLISLLVGVALLALTL